MTGGSTDGDPRRIRWAPKLQPARLVQLYRSDAAGRLDDELLDDVGWTLYWRCRDVRRVTGGRVVCPGCGCDFALLPAEVGESVCPQCGWSTTREHWHRSWEHRDLNGHCPEFDRFIAQWPGAATPAARMLLVDRLVHALHTAARGQDFGNFAARNLLEGNRPSIARVLDALAYGPSSHADSAVHEHWRTVTAPYFSARQHRPNDA